jgi:hypothetical protein
MSHPFHYFIPNANSTGWCLGGLLPADRLKEHHLGHLVHLAGPGKAAICDAQIDGVMGLLFTPNVDGRFAREIGYKAGSQTWMKASGKVWIGWEKDDQPGPKELERPELIRGYTVSDEAGNQWCVPIARSPRGMATLPSDLVWDVETGEPQSQRKPAYDWLWELSGEIFDYLNNPNRPADLPWLRKSALKIMQVNYRISPLELNAFQAMGRCVIDEMRANLIALALIDNEIVEAVAGNDEAKKNETPPG